MDGVNVAVLPVAPPGIQVYVPAPVAESCADDPAHSATSGPAFTMGRGLTVTITAAVSLQPIPLVPMTV